MSPFERLLQLYSEFCACSPRSPDQEAKLRAFEEAVYRASQDGSFNDQLPPDGLKAWVHSVWRDQHR